MVDVKMDEEEPEDKERETKGQEQVKPVADFATFKLPPIRTVE